MMHSPYLGHDAELLTKKPEALEDLGIIPENPPPPPLEEKNPADMTRAELMQVARRFQVWPSVMLCRGFCFSTRLHPADDPEPGQHHGEQMKIIAVYIDMVCQLLSMVHRRVG